MTTGDGEYDRRAHVMNMKLNKKRSMADEMASQTEMVLYQRYLYKMMRTTVMTMTTPIKMEALAIDIQSLVPLDSWESSLNGV